MHSQYITRRVFMTNSVMLLTVPVLLSACNRSLGLQKITSDGEFFDARQLTILCDVAEILIPSTETPGATEAHVIAVLDAMMLTWAGELTRKQFITFLAQLEDISQARHAQAYSLLERVQREKLLVSIDSFAFVDQSTEVSKNYRHLKDLIFHLFYSSEEANPNYRLIPGDYLGCVSNDDLQTIYARGHL